MKKAVLRISALLLLVGMLVSFVGCSQNSEQNESTAAASTSETVTQAEFVDYVSQLTLDMSSETAKVEATVYSFVDGDTTWFNTTSAVDGSTQVKARYLAINTPESTGKIEEWGKKASNFTKEKLSSAVSIILESDDANWNVDSTGSRYLLWIWYKTAEDEPYRNLNLEILQEGLARGSSTGDNRYGDICMNAFNQAASFELNVFSNEKDPDYYYGDIIYLDLKELRTNTEEYNGMDVAFTGVVTEKNGQTCYVEYYDEETQLYYGMTVYFGYSLSGTGLEILTVGNEVKIVGSVQYYENGGTWQVSDIEYKEMKPDNDSNIQLITEGCAPAYTLISAADLMTGTVEIMDDEGNTATYNYGDLVMSSSVSLENLTVTDVYMTGNEDSSSYGAWSLTCQAEDGTELVVRTIPLYDENGELYTADAFLGFTINVKGIVDYYNSNYQVKVFSMDDIEYIVD